MSAVRHVKTYGVHASLVHFRQHFVRACGRAGGTDYLGFSKRSHERGNMSVVSEKCKVFLTQSQYIGLGSRDGGTCRSALQLFSVWSLVSTFLQLLEMFFGDMTHNIPGIMKPSAYNYFIFVWQKIKNEMTRVFYGSPSPSTTQHRVVAANIFADFRTAFAT